MTERLLLVTPTRRDAELTTGFLRDAGFDFLTCENMAALCREVKVGAGAVLLTDDLLARENGAQFADVLREQPPWSDLPVILLSPLGADSPNAVWAMNALSNVTVLDQPVRVLTLISALRTAVNARRRQYELRDRLEALRNADRQKDEFLAVLSHELRNPLAPIRNALHILRLAGADEQTRTRVVDTMERQVGNVIRLVDDLLELSRINEGRIELRKERIRLTAVLRSALEASGQLVEAAGHELSVAEPAEQVLLYADPVRLIQVIANLLNNAAKYTDGGGRITLSARAEGNDAVISVRDTGIGIPPEMLSRIFEMFVQVDASHDRSRQGLGIGLTLVKRLVEMHGGSVEARSAGLGKGSEFVVRVPAIADQRVTPGNDAPRQRRGAERRKSDLVRFRILVVDDHHDAGDSLATLLRLLGHQVRVAYDGLAALDAVKAFRPEVVLLDIGMPGMDGFEVASRLRQDPALERLLIVALTGYGRDEDLRRSAAAGFDAHLVKPVDVGVLNTLLAQHGARVAQQALTQSAPR
jgi:signal transduction histidine kinase/ActR/RegA family two-component response regulator